jgi:thiol-disulfide isomerase/thioredoxin
MFAVLIPATMFAADEKAPASPNSGEPVDAKARKAWHDAVEQEKQRAYAAAARSYLKANQQDGGHCAECLQRAVWLMFTIGEYKDSETIARQMLAQAATDADKAAAHYALGLALQRQGLGGTSNKQKCFDESCAEFRAALDTDPRKSAARFCLGVSLANLHRDEEARKEFAAYLEQDKSPSLIRVRAERYADNIELARAKMAPPFAITTLDGQHISLDALQGKVVLIDFWATWCAPCRNALPHIQRIAQRFAGQPLVILSISLDKDEAKWKKYVENNGMTWLQYREDGFEGAIAKRFGVHAIPATFTIDSDGVLEDQHVGDADIEGKLKKLVAHAVEVDKRKSLEVAAQPAN